MDKIVDILVNLSPIIILLFVAIFLYTIYLDKDPLPYFINFILWGYMIFFYHAISILYGNIVLICITGIIICIFYILYLIYLFNSIDGIAEKIFYSFLFISHLYLLLSFIYYRLDYEDILSIAWINKMWEKFYDIKFLKLFEGLLKNEWIKEISIGTISTVSGGLILNKLKKKPKKEFSVTFGNGMKRNIKKKKIRRTKND